MTSVLVFHKSTNENISQFLSDIVPVVGDEIEIDQEPFKVVSTKHILFNKKDFLHSHYYKVIVIDAD